MAMTLRAASSVTAQGAVPEQAPLHPAKRKPAAGRATSVAERPRSSCEVAALRALEGRRGRQANAASRGACAAGSRRRAAAAAGARATRSPARRTSCPSGRSSRRGRCQGFASRAPSGYSPRDRGRRSTLSQTWPPFGRRALVRARCPASAPRPWISSWTATAAFEPPAPTSPPHSELQPDEGDAREASLRRRAARDERRAAHPVAERRGAVVVDDVLLRRQRLDAPGDPTAARPQPVRVRPCTRRRSGAGGRSRDRASRTSTCSPGMRRGRSAGPCVESSRRHQASIAAVSVAIAEASVPKRRRRPAPRTSRGRGSTTRGRASGLRSTAVGWPSPHQSTTARAGSAGRRRRSRRTSRCGRSDFSARSRRRRLQRGRAPTALRSRPPSHRRRLAAAPGRAPIEPSVSLSLRAVKAALRSIPSREPRSASARRLRRASSGRIALRRSAVPPGADRIYGLARAATGSSEAPGRDVVYGRPRVPTGFCSGTASAMWRRAVRDEIRCSPTAPMSCSATARPCSSCRRSRMLRLLARSSRACTAAGRRRASS